MLREVFERGKELADKVTNVVMNYTEVEAKVRSATNDDPWGPHGQDMQEIAEYTKHYDTMSQVMGMLWRRMFHEQKCNWRRTYKSLLLLSYLLRNGSERIVASCKEHMYDLKLLESYQFIDENGKDQGVNIRHKAKSLISLLENASQLSSERKKAASNRSKYNGGISSSASVNGYHGQHQSHGRANYSQRYGGSDDDNDNTTTTNGVDTVANSNTTSSGGMSTRPKSPVAAAKAGPVRNASCGQLSQLSPPPATRTEPIVNLLDLSTGPSAVPVSSPATAAATITSSSSVSASACPVTDSFDPFRLSQVAQALSQGPSSSTVVSPAGAVHAAAGGPIRGPSLPSSPTAGWDHLTSDVPDSAQTTGAFQLQLDRHSDEFDGFVCGPAPRTTPSQAAPTAAAVPLTSAFTDLEQLFSSTSAASGIGGHFGMATPVAPITLGQSAAGTCQATPNPVCGAGRGTPQQQMLIGATWTDVGSVDISLDSLGRSRHRAPVGTSSTGSASVGSGTVTPSRSLNELQRQQLHQQQQRQFSLSAAIPAPIAALSATTAGHPPPVAGSAFNDLLFL